MKGLYMLGLLACLAGCQKTSDQAQAPARTEPSRSLAKFEPANGKVYLFAGQELHAVGGLDEFNDGYLDHFKTPAGWTAYTNLTPGEDSFGYQMEGLDGIWETDDWGDSVSNMSMQIDDPDYQNMALAIGLSMVGHEGAIARGERDSLIVKLGNFLKSIAPRPVFLRIGYEFDGHAWNHYDQQDYLASYRRIKDTYDQMGITNVAYVWQSTGWVSDPQLLEEWYPGDEYVDWCGFSFFSRWKEQEMIEFARNKGKPVFIAEASPTISDHMVKFDGSTRETILSNPDQASEAWERWFTPFFSTIEDNPDVVKAISYINCNWKDHVMWKENPTFRFVDARLQTSKSISEQWQEKVYNDRYVHAHDQLFDEMYNNQ